MNIGCSKRRNPALLLLLTMSVVSNLGSLVHPLPPELRKQVRDLEKVSFRRCKAECSLLFNSVCAKENLLPNYSNQYVGNEYVSNEYVGTEHVHDEYVGDMNIYFNRSK